MNGMKGRVQGGEFRAVSVVPVDSAVGVPVTVT